MASGTGVPEGAYLRIWQSSCFPFDLNSVSRPTCLNVHAHMHLDFHYHAVMLFICGQSMLKLGFDYAKDPVRIPCLWLYVSEV